MGFISRNKFSNAWDKVLMYTTTEIGLGKPWAPMLATSNEIVMAASIVARKAFEHWGLSPEDAVLLGKAYYVGMLAAEHPDSVNQDSLSPSVEEVSSVLAGRYGKEKIRELRSFAEFSAARLGVPLPADTEPTIGSNLSKLGRQSREDVMDEDTIRFSISFDISPQGFNYELSPPVVPTSLVVEILLSYLLGLKQQLDGAPALKPDEARAWQMLGRLD